VRNLAEDIFHPGGEELTQKTIAAMNLRPGASIADLGCGTGTSALMLAGDPGLNISAIDISADNIKRAQDRLSTTNETPGNVRFQQADAHELPFEDAQFDGVLAECTFSLFANQAAVLTEIKRVLKPDGQLGITDMAVGGRLPDDIASVVAPWTCLVDAVDQQAYADTFTGAGFEIMQFSDESTGLTTLINTLKRKLLMLGVGTTLAGVKAPQVDIGEIKHWLDRFNEEVEKGTIRYLRFSLRKT
jgi:SAM-dependent methyltransferase